VAVTDDHLVYDHPILPVVTLVIITLVMIVFWFGVVFPAVWSRKPERARGRTPYGQQSSRVARMTTKKEAGDDQEAGEDPEAPNESAPS
jgi:hypothetical protein